MSRCMNIALALKNCGVESVFCSSSPSELFPRLHQEVKRGNLHYFLLPACKDERHVGGGQFSEICSICDGKETLSAIRREKIDLVIFDFYGLGGSWNSIVRNEVPTCQIADFPGMVPVDYLIDYGFDAAPEKHVQAIGPETKTMLGPAFAPISQEYQRFETQVTTKPASISRVLVSLGGSRPSAEIHQVLEEVRNVYPLARITLAGNVPFTQAFIGDSSLSNLQVVQAEGLADLFAESDLSIVGGGVSMYEQIASGKPGIIVETANNQRFALGKAISDGVVDGALRPTRGKVEALLRELAQRESLDQERWLELRSTVDHWGSLRIALNLVDFDLRELSLRQITAGDVPFLLRVTNQTTSRENSLVSRKVTAAEHLSWSSQLFDGRIRGWVVTWRDLPLGQCRIQEEEGRYFLSYSVQQEFQGRGIAGRMLQLLFEREKFSSQIFARVKSANYSSAALLERLGFRKVEVSNDLLTYATPA